MHTEGTQRQSHNGIVFDTAPLFTLVMLLFMALTAGPFTLAGELCLVLFTGCWIAIYQRVCRLDHIAVLVNDV